MKQALIYEWPTTLSSEPKYLSLKTIIFYYLQKIALLIVITLISLRYLCKFIWSDYQICFLELELFNIQAAKLQYKFTLAKANTSVVQQTFHNNSYS
jgi:hypothetical protein